MSLIRTVLIAALLTGCASTNSYVDVEADVQMDIVVEILNDATRMHANDEITRAVAVYVLQQSKQAERQLLASKRRDSKKRLQVGITHVCNMKVAIKRFEGCEI